MKARIETGRWILVLVAVGLAVACSDDRAAQPGAGGSDLPVATEKGLEQEARQVEADVENDAVADAARKVDAAAQKAADDVDARGTMAAAEAEAKQLEQNVKESAALMEETYDEKRKEGEGRVEAAGDSYNAVIDAGKQE